MNATQIPPFFVLENQYFLSEIWESHSEGELLPGPLGRRRSQARATTDTEDGVWVVAANRVK